ncbi:MAG: hypothetical protein ACRD0J_06250, partial [Acidimicrobiales bacterium]
MTEATLTPGPLRRRRRSGRRRPGKSRWRAGSAPLGAAAAASLSLVAAVGLAGPALAQGAGGAVPAPA